MKKWLSLYVLIMMITILSACSNTKTTSSENVGDAETVTISGSTSVGPLVEKLAVHYEKI